MNLKILRTIIGFYLSAVGLCFASSLEEKLRKAVQERDIDTVKECIAKKANVNHYVDGRAILADALDTHSYEIVKILIEAGADVDKGSHQVERAGKIQCFFHHITYALDIDAPNNIVELLIEYSKADPKKNWRVYGFFTPHKLAENKNRLDILTLLPPF